MNWPYFDLVGFEDGDVYKLVDEDGQDLTEDGSLVLFASFDEAEAYLEENNIRGTIR